MNKQQKLTVTILLVLNIMVLLGQVWPAGAPPFARVINILFLIGNLGFYLRLLIKDTPTSK